MLASVAPSDTEKTILEEELITSFDGKSKFIKVMMERGFLHSW